MSTRRFWLFSLSTTLLLAVLLALGTWQLQRLEWKEALIADIQAGMEAPTQPLPAQLKEDFEFRHYEVQGTFVHDLERHIYRPAPNAVSYTHLRAHETR